MTEATISTARIRKFRPGSPGSTGGHYYLGAINLFLTTYISRADFYSIEMQSTVWSISIKDTGLSTHSKSVGQLLQPKTAWTGRYLAKKDRIPYQPRPETYPRQ